MSNDIFDKDVIVGFSLDIKASELAEYTAKRAAHHGKRAELYEAEVERIAAIKKGDDEETQMIGKLSNTKDPVADMQQSAKHHRRRERFFQFASEHFAEGRTYRLTADALTTLEIMPGRGY
jgi:hypothetical protein